MKRNKRSPNEEDQGLNNSHRTSKSVTLSRLEKYDTIVSHRRQPSWLCGWIRMALPLSNGHSFSSMSRHCLHSLSGTCEVHQQQKPQTCIEKTHKRVTTKNKCVCIVISSRVTHLRTRRHAMELNRMVLTKLCVGQRWTIEGGGVCKERSYRRDTVQLFV